MGNEAVNCFRCQAPLADADFKSGAAIRKWNNTVCGKCAGELGVGKKDQEPEPEKGRDRRRRGPPPGEKPQVDVPRKLTLLLASAAGLLLLVIGGLLLLGGPEQPDPGEERVAPKTVEGTPPKPPDSPAQFLGKARLYAKQNPRDFSGQIARFEQAVLQAKGTPDERETKLQLEQVLKHQRQAIADGIATLDAGIGEAKNREEFAKASTLVEEARGSMTSMDWTMLLDKRAREVQVMADGRYRQVEREAIEAKRTGRPQDVDAARKRVEAWGFEPLVASLEKALGAVKPGAAPRSR